MEQSPQKVVVDAPTSGRIPLSIPEIALIAGTRGILGFGLGLLLGNQIPANSKRAVGWTLLSVGAASTIPIAWALWSGRAKVTDRGVEPGWHLKTA